MKQNVQPGDLSAASDNDGVNKRYRAKQEAKCCPRDEGTVEPPTTSVDHGARGASPTQSRNVFSIRSIRSWVPIEPVTKATM